MSKSNKKNRIALQNLIKFLLKENIDNSIEIINLQVFIHKNVKMKKKDNKKLLKRINRLVDKVKRNVKFLEEIHKNDKK